MMDPVAAKLTDTERTAILADIDAGLPRNEIARKHRRSPGTVTTIAVEGGRSFDRTAAKTATEARRSDLASKRTELAMSLLDEAKDLVGKLHEPYLVWNFGGSENTYNEHELAEPPIEAKQRTFVMAGIAIDKAIAVEKAEQDEGVGEAASLLELLVAGVRGAA